MNPIPSKNLSHSEHCKQAIGWVMGAKHACTCGAVKREAERIATEKDAARYQWLRSQLRSKDAMVKAQALFWHYRSRKEFDRAVDNAREDDIKAVHCSEPSEAKR